jgi:hypothetical protein
MPWILAICALVLVGGGCFFKADYGGGGFKCADGRCPGELICRPTDQICVTSLEPGDAGTDTPTDTVDAREPALTCADPGTIPATGGMVMGSTADEVSRISAMCDNGVMNGKDEVYRITLPADGQLLVEISGGPSAYVLPACPTSPGTPMCVGDVRATTDNPISVGVLAGDRFVVVDDLVAGAGGEYTLRVTVN